MSSREADASDIAALALRGIEIRPGDVALVSGPRGAPDGVVTASRKPFESEMLGMQVAQIDWLDSLAGSADLTCLAYAAVKRLTTQKFAYVAARRDEQDSQAVDALQASGLRVVECLVTLRRNLSDSPSNAPSDTVGIATPDDADGIAAVGATSFTHDRFHADPRIDKAAADKLKATWARNAVLGRSDKVFVTRSDCVVSGFNACLLRHGQAIIDLIGISPQHQGKGLGRALMQAAMAHYSGKASHMLVGTQSRNHASLGLYTSLGFRVHASAFTLSKHLA